MGSTTSSRSDDVNRPTRNSWVSRHGPPFSPSFPLDDRGGTGSEIFGVLCERLNGRVYGIVFSRDSWSAWGWNNTKLKTRRGLIGARLIFNKNYDGAREGERRALRLKNSPVPGGTRWPRNLKLRKLGNRTTGWARETPYIVSLLFPSRVLGNNYVANDAFARVDAVLSGNFSQTRF